MRILVCLDGADCRHWLAGFRTQIEAAGHSLRFDIRPGAGRTDRAIDRLVCLENRVLGGARPLWRRLSCDALPASEAGFAPDITFELSSASAPAPPSGAWRALALTLDQTGGIGRLARALLDGHAPRLDVIDSAGAVAASGLPAVERLPTLSHALDGFTARVATLLLMALDGRSRMAVDEAHRASPPRSTGAFRFGLRALAGKVGQRIAPARLKAEHWRVGLRPVRPGFSIAGDTLIDGFAWLEDDGRRYYADPILWTEAGRDFLFLEEFQYSTGRGLIAYTEIGPDGRALFAPRPIIERATHLSYPFLFRHGGDVFMVPENTAEGHTPLYRARQFPDRWEHVGPLLAEVALHDATLFDHAGSWWLFGNAALHGGSSWDCLLAFRAPSPLGPFEPHPANPVLVDARLARPGGPVLVVDGRLIRPVQSCLGGYGRFTRFVEISELSMARFTQVQRGRMLAPRGGVIAGVHTYSRNARFEAIDALAPRAYRL